MPATIKEQKFLEVTLTDSTLDDTTFKLDNPRDDLTAEQVTTAFSNMLNKAFWLSTKNAAQFTAIKKTEIVQQTVVRYPVGEEP